MTRQIVLNTIEKLEKIIPDDEFAYEEAIRAFLSLEKVPVLIDKVSANTSICRTRTHSKNETLFEKVSDIFIAPKIAVANYARCNKPFQPKLYGSGDRPTSYLELVKIWLDSSKEGDKLLVTVGQWTIQRDFNLVIVTTPDKEKRASYFDKHYGGYLDKYIKQYNNNTQAGFIEFYKYLFCKFRKEAKNDKQTYIITTAYCNLALNLAKDQADGILYPSVPANGNGMNLSFNSSISTLSNFRLSSVIRNEITVIKEGKKTNFKETGLLKAKSFDTTKDEIIW